MKSNKKRGILTYTAYNFEDDKDPAIYAANTAVQDSGYSYKEIKEKGGATPGTLRRWEYGRTRTARFDTWAATIRACKGSIFVKTATGKEIKIEPKKKR